VEAVGLDASGDRISQPLTSQRFEVWNRLEEPLFLVSAGGERLEVPACGHAIAENFSLTTVQVRVAGGYVFSFAAGTSPSRSGTWYLVITDQAARTGMFREGGGALTDVAPQFPLPPCEGLAPVTPE
jgi:hypothetical protein